MSQLLKKTIHDCQPPTPTEQDADHKWTCDDCGQEWNWRPLRTYEYSVPHGFLGLRRRTVTRSYGGSWHTFGEASKRVRWEEVGPTEDPECEQHSPRRFRDIEGHHFKCVKCGQRLHINISTTELVEFDPDTGKERPAKDPWVGPHSMACPPGPHFHGGACHGSCPICHGLEAHWVDGSQL